MRRGCLRVTTADVILDGGSVWEMKAPKSSSMKAVEKNLRRATEQSENVIFDSRRMKGIPDQAIERELHTCASGRVRKLRRLMFVNLFVNRKAQVIDIK